MCFNTVALVFLLDIDDVAYDAAVPPRIKASLERRAKTTSKNVCDPGAIHRSMLLIVFFVAVLVRLAILAMGTGASMAVVLVEVVLCWLAFVPGEVNLLLSGSKRSGAVAVRCVAQVLGAPVAGLFWFWTMTIMRKMVEK